MPLMPCRCLATLVVATIASTAPPAFAQTGGPTAPGSPAAAVASGCWVQMYDERDFKGDMLTIAGPSEVQAMDDASGRAFKRRIDSLTVGPKATLTVFEHRLFKDRSAMFGPNSREAGLVRKLGFGGRIQSMRVDCAS